MAKILPCKDKGYEFEVPLKKRRSNEPDRVSHMRIHTVFKYSDTKFDYYLERLYHKTGEWEFIHKLVKHETIKKYFK